MTAGGPYHFEGAEKARKGFLAMLGMTGFRGFVAMMTKSLSARARVVTSMKIPTRHPESPEQLRMIEQPIRNYVPHLALLLPYPVHSQQPR